MKVVLGPHDFKADQLTQGKYSRRSTISSNEIMWRIHNLPNFEIFFKFTEIHRFGGRFA